MVYLIIFHVFLSYSLMARPCFLLLKCPKEQLVYPKWQPTGKKWTFQWKMSFTSDPKNQAHEVIFCRKATKKIRPKIFSNNIPLSWADSLKYIGLHLYSKINFDVRIKLILTKLNRTIGLLQNFNKYYLDPVFKTTGWLQGRHKLSSFRGRSSVRKSIRNLC